jgi:hypothetical protein
MDREESCFMKCGQRKPVKYRNFWPERTSNTLQHSYMLTHACKSTAWVKRFSKALHSSKFSKLVVLARTWVSVFEMSINGCCLILTQRRDCKSEGLPFSYISCILQKLAGSSSPEGWTKVGFMLLPRWSFTHESNDIFPKKN